MAETHHTPPAAVQKAAQRGLDMRAEHKRGGIGPGQARARQLVSGKPMPVATVKRMHSYFSRHAVDKQGADFHNTEKPSNGRIAWELWGGDAGQKWAKGIVEKAETAATSEKTFAHAATGSSASVETHSGPNPFAVVSGVSTPQGGRRQGGAHAVMKQVTNHLDKHGLMAVLHPAPEKGSGVTKAQLKKFYKQHGFEWEGKDATGSTLYGTMVRHPKGRETAGGTADTTYTLGVNDSDGSLWNLLSYLKKCGSDGHSVSFTIDDQSFGFDGDGSDKILTLEKSGGETASEGVSYTLTVRDGDQQLSELLAYLKQHSDAGNIALIEVSGDQRTRRFVWNGQGGASIMKIDTRRPTLDLANHIDILRGKMQENAAVEPRPLYVCRYLTPESAAELARWASENGFPALDEADLHVTIVYSKGAVNWMKCGAAYGQNVYVPPGGARSLERFGPEGEENVIVLCFLSEDLAYRQRGLLKAGCTTDWPDYQPHITLCQDPDRKIDIRALKAYQGELVFGPETFSDIQADAGTKVTAHLEALRAKVRG